VGMCAKWDHRPLNMGMCAIRKAERETIKINRIRKAGGDWPLSNSDLANKHTK